MHRRRRARAPMLSEREAPFHARVTRRRSSGSYSTGCPRSSPTSVFTHASWTARRSESYERLAFLGDSVLALAVTSHLYPRLEAERFGPGRLTKIRAQAVSGRSCREVAERLGVPERLSAAAPPGVASTVPALIGDRARAGVGDRGGDRRLLPAYGYERTAEAVVAAFAPEIEEALEHPVDFKSALQERLARKGALVTYDVVDEQGPPHDRVFSVSATIAGVEVGRGTGPEQEGRRAGGRAGGAGGARMNIPGRSPMNPRMYLKSIVLKGFKSFPDRTKLEFGPGVSVIVGPNGSGKSNITDAVLWALGEQSPLAVRGQSMQDVIFGGAPGRQGARGAEVELVLDDSEGMLGLGAPEVSIVRRLDRAGEGEYRLAGARCRLVDVIEVLSDTGLGKEMHSVISQGRVESIVTSKPRDRRMLIEEAAGLGKHRKRRRRAQLKLARTQDNLDRALDVEREARSRLRPLKRQAEAAELHARLERQTLEARWELGRDDLRRHQAELADRRGSRRRRRAPSASRSSASSPRSPAAARRPRRRWRSAAPIARSCPDAASSPSPPAIACPTAPRRCARRERNVEARLRSGREHLAAVARRPRRPTSPIRRPTRGSPSSSRSSPGSSATARPSSRASSPSSRNSCAPPAPPSASGRRSSSSAQVAREQARERLEQARGAAARGRAGGRGRPPRGRAGRRRARGLQPVPAQPDRRPRRRHRPRRPARGRSRLRARGRGRARRPAARRGARRPGRRRRAARSRRRRRRPRARRAVRRPDPGAGERRAAARTTEPSRSPATSTGPAQAAALARALLRDVWVVESLERLPDRFDGVAVTLSGRVWSSRTRELRQAPAVGEERVLAERNRRDALVRASEAAVQAEHAAGAALERHGEAVARADARVRERDRGAPRGGHPARRGERGASGGSRRRSSAGGRRPTTVPTPGVACRWPPSSRAARAAREREQRERAERQARIERLRRGDAARRGAVARASAR